MEKKHCLIYLTDKIPEHAFVLFFYPYNYIYKIVLYLNQEILHMVSLYNTLAEMIT